MKDIYKYTIDCNDSLINLLKKINSSPYIQTIFIVEKNNLIASVTDGDIRRGLIRGLSIKSNIIDFANKNFHFLVEGTYDSNKINTLRKNKIKAVPVLNKSNEIVDILDFTRMKSTLPIDAVIMAGGKGERLRPLTNLVPKPLLKVGGKEIISYNIDRLYQYGIKNQTISVNYLGKQIEDFCSNYNENINFNFIREKKYLGTAGSLAFIDKFHNDTILLMNSDILTNIDYEDLYSTFIKSNADFLVASIAYPVNLPYAIFEFDAKNHVQAFREKPKFNYFANAGIYLMKKKLINLIPKEDFFDATDLMQKIINSNKSLIHYPLSSYWLDIGKHRDFEKAQNDIGQIIF